MTRRPVRGACSAPPACSVRAWPGWSRHGCSPTTPALHPPHQVVTYVDGAEQISTPNARFVASSRPFLESVVRRRTVARCRELPPIFREAVVGEQVGEVLQKVIVEAAWQTSTAGDAARLDLAKPPATDEERRRAWAMQQIRAAAGRDLRVGTAFRAVGFMTAHPEIREAYGD